MPYVISKTSGTVLTTVPDNTVNSSATDLTLVGKNYSGYGAFLNSNFIKLLENFSNDSSPAHPLTGQLWYDTRNKTLKVYNGSIWKQVHTSAAGVNSPDNPVAGDLWWDTTNTLLKVWGGSSWIVVGPSTSLGTTTTGAIAETVVDTLSLSHTILKLAISNDTIAILSRDSASFVPQPAIPGFPTIYPGLNLVDTNSLLGSQIFASQITLGDTANVTISDGSGSVNIIGTTPNSDLNIFVEKGNVSTKAIGITGSTAKVTLSNDLQVGGVTSLQSNLTVSGLSSLASNLSVAGATAIASTLNVTGLTALAGNLSVTGYTLVTNKILPTSAGSIDIGSESSKFGNIYATVINSNITVRNGYVPTTANSAGSTGQISFDSSHFYLCVAANTWVRANLVTW